MFDGPHHPRRTARALIALIVALTAGLGLATSASADQRFAPSALADAAPTAASAGRATPRIVGGHSLRDTSSAPYTVALQTKFSAKEVGSCSGTVLDALHVLTAAHCVVNKGVAATPENVRVAAGASDLTSDAGIALATVANVARIRVHPHYVSTEFADDVAVLTLAAPLDLTTGKVAALPMAPVGTTLDAGRSVRVTGFGISRTGKDDFGTLRSVTTRAVTAGLCGTTAPAAMLCTYRDQHAACEGDSGGTATIGSPRLLIGVTDLAVKNCAAGLNLYANVAAPEIRGFIDAAVAEQDLTREQIPARAARGPNGADARHPRGRPHGHVPGGKLDRLAEVPLRVLPDQGQPAAGDQAGQEADLPPARLRSRLAVRLRRRGLERRRHRRVVLAHRPHGALSGLRPQRAAPARGGLGTPRRRRSSISAQTATNRATIA